MRHLPSIRWRIGLISLVGLVAVILVPITLIYSARGIDRATSLPQPSQLAAIVALVEDTTTSEQAAIFEAMRSTNLSLRVSPEAEVTTDLDPFWVDEPERLAAYQLALGERDFAVYEVRGRLLPGGIFTPLLAAEFRVGLETGGVLIMAVEGFAMVTRSGLPVGFPPAVLGVIIAFGTLLLLNREFRSVLRLAREVERLDPSDPNAKLTPIRARTAEVRALAEAFNRQQERVSTLLRSRSVLIGGIQHDVRTFATRLRLRIEKLSDPTDRAQAEADIEDLITLMDSALLATRGEAGKLNIELIDIVEFLEREVEARTKTGLMVTFTGPEEEAGAQVLADRLALKRVASNLMENAVRYGEVAHVSLQLEPDFLTILVDDEGEGIPPDQRQDLLEPFARQEQSRSRETGGSGLGLAIVKAVVAGHDGSLTIEDAPTGGARVSVRLPRFHA